MSYSPLSCLTDDLEAVFSHFYTRMLSNRDFSQFFDSPAQIDALIHKQRSYFLTSLTLPEGQLRDIYVTLGEIHYDMKLPFIDFLAALTILEEQILAVAARKEEPEIIIEAAFSFFRKVRGFVAKGYLNRMLAVDLRDIDLYLDNVHRSAKMDTSFATERILWLRQLLFAIQVERRTEAPPMEFSPETARSIDSAVAKDSELRTYIDETLARIRIEASNVFYFLESKNYEEVLSLYRELTNIYKLILMLTNVVIVASSSSVIDALNRDPLTGLLTRASLSAIIGRELSIAASSDYPLSLIVCDIDHFKSINDTYGHNGGDQVLRQVASLIKAGIRATDFAFRYGGEEFLLVLRGASEKVCLQLAEHLRKTILQEPFNYGQETIRVTCSFGIATFRPPFPETFGEMFMIADDKLYLAKRNGRNQVCA